MKHKSQSIELDMDYLRSTFEPISHLMDNESINEIIINPAGNREASVWVMMNNGDEFESTDKNGNQLRLDINKLQQIISYVGGSNSRFTHEDSPALEARIPYYNYRFTAVMQPASLDSHIFNIRKFSPKLYTFDDYEEQGLLKPEWNKVIRGWIEQDFSVLIAGCTNVGKTTYLKSYIQEKRKVHGEQHWVIIQDRAELTLPFGNIQWLMTTNNVTMDDLVKITLGLSPSQTVIGEVRSKEAYTFMKLMLTGHPGLSSMHAYSVEDALARFEMMCKEHREVGNLDKAQIANAIDGIISIQKEKFKGRDPVTGNPTRGLRRFINGIKEVNGYDSTYNRYATRDIV